MNPVLKKYDIAAGVTAFSTTRAGGVSTGSYASFNANHYCGDDRPHVAENRRLLCRSLEIEDSHLILPHQTHGIQLRQIDADFFLQSEDKRKDSLEGVDAICTILPHVCVCVSTADCIPVLLYDEDHKVVAAVHAGWRGTCQRIVSHTLHQLHVLYGTKGQDVKAVIGPGISLDAFEVGDEVYTAFEKENFDMHQIAQRYPTSTGGEKWHLDLWKCNQLQLIENDVLADKIQIAGICTYSDYQNYFSARRLGIHSGRILNGIMLDL